MIKLSVLAVGVILAACVTVNIYFPAAAVQKAADEIVTDVRGKEAPQPEKKSPSGSAGPEKGSGLFQFFRRTASFTSSADAQVNVEVSTPAVRALRESLKQRFPQLKPFYEKGALGENNAGLLDARDLSGLSLKERSDLNRLLSEENKDRQALYSEIQKANKFGPEVLPQIQKIFANSWRDNSQAGWWIQNDQGEWQKK